MLETAPISSAIRDSLDAVRSALPESLPLHCHHREWLPADRAPELGRRDMPWKDQDGKPVSGLVDCAIRSDDTTVIDGTTYTAWDLYSLVRCGDHGSVGGIGSSREMRQDYRQYALTDGLRHQQFLAGSLAEAAQAQREAGKGAMLLLSDEFVWKGDRWLWICDLFVPGDGRMPEGSTVPDGSAPDSDRRLWESEAGEQMFRGR